MDFELLKLPHLVLQRMDVVYTFILLLTRYSAFFLFVPGIGMGQQGLLVRGPAIFVLALASLAGSAFAPLPADWLPVLGALLSELLLGSVLGMIPLLLVSAVQTGAQIASSSMGLGANSLIDPTSGAQVSDLGRLLGDLTIILFLMIGGHHMVIHAVAGLGGEIIPGTFALSESSINLLIARTADIFRVGAMIAAPVVVALLLTQFVMGLVSRAVPTVNIFVVSFPLTIGIGLVLSVLALPDMLAMIRREMMGMERSVAIVADDMKETPRAAPVVPVPDAPSP